MLLQASQPMEPTRVERLAREMGMVYPEEVVPFTEPDPGGVR